ncbi:hypothetical protein C0J52_05448 [Blattella germanica]|nr:hypothetical protein C0J52_05448 [Blattella germanica]
MEILLKTASGINCYQCISTSTDDPFQCNEYLGSDIDLEPKSCDAVFGAQYCIKHTGRFEAWEWNISLRKWMELKLACCVFFAMLLGDGSAVGIDCFQCSSSKTMDCADNLIHDGTLSATSCDHVFEASYCIKTVGLYGGGLGTKRFCSSLDLGNYCNYIRQPGDQLEYRSCVFTCSTDGCNPANRKQPQHLVMTLAAVFVTIVAFLRL